MVKRKKTKAQTKKVKKPITLFKVVDKNLQSVHGGSYKYKLNIWTLPIREPSVCQWGYHVIPIEELPTWYSPKGYQKLFMVEVQGKYDGNIGYKISYESIRLTLEIAPWLAEMIHQMLLGLKYSGVSKVAKRRYAENILKKQGYM